MNPNYAQALRVVDHYGGPLGVAGKLVGLGSEEMEAGIPWWSWCAVGALIGGTLVYATRHKLDRIFSN